MSADNDSRLSAPIDLLRVRQLFSHPERLRDADFLLREISARMHERLALVKVDPRRILDAGCGAGADLASLQKRFAEAQIFGVDAAVPMLQAASKEQRSAWSALNEVIGQWLPGRLRGAAPPSLIAADFANLPFAHQAFDLVWSSLALHWHPQPDRVFSEWRRVLKTEGLLMFCCFGPDALKEVRAAFGALDGLPHALPFVDMHDFGDMLVEAGFSTPVMDMETITLTYESVDKLWSDLRALGGNPLTTRRRGLVGRKAWAKVAAALDANRRTDGQIPLTIEIIYGHAFKPVPRTTSQGESIVRFQPRK